MIFLHKQIQSNWAILLQNFVMRKSNMLLITIFHQIYIIHIALLWIFFNLKLSKSTIFLLVALGYQVKFEDFMEQIFGSNHRQSQNDHLKADEYINQASNDGLKKFNCITLPNYFNIKAQCWRSTNISISQKMRERLYV